MMTPRQRDALAFIERYQAENPGLSPPFEDIRVGLDLASRSQVSKVLNGLEERGLLRRIRARARAIEIVKAADPEELLLELCDRVSCHVAERPNYLSTETRRALIAAAKAAVSRRPLAAE